MDFLKKLRESRWLPWVGVAPFIIVPAAVIVSGEVLKGIGFIAFFISMWVGVILGGKLAVAVATHVFRASDGIVARFAVAGGAFGFLYLPPLVGIFTNNYLDTEIDMNSLGTHFLWACIGAVIFFCINPSNSET